MKTRLIIFIGLMVLLNSAAGQIPDSLKYISLNPQEFQKAYQDDDNALLIDVREYFEYKKQRIEKSVNMPSSGNPDEYADTLNKGSSLFLYCSSGFRSRRVAEKLYDKGFLKLYSLEGGINAWKKEGLPVNKKKIKK